MTKNRKLAQSMLKIKISGYRQNKLLGDDRMMASYKKDIAAIFKNRWIK